MKNTLLSLLLNSFVVIGIIGCNGGGSNNIAQTKFGLQNNPLADNQKENLKDDFILMQMGSGFNSITKKAPSGQSCLKAASNPSNIYISNPMAIITLDKAQDLTTLQNNLGVDVSGLYGADRFVYSMAAEFAKSSKDNNYATNIIYLYKYAGKAKFINGSIKESDAALTPVAAYMVHEDQKRFQEMCGDNFVEQMDAGATLGVKLTLAFNSHSDQEKFKAKFTSNVGIDNITASIKQAAENSKVNVKFSLNALQLGGEPEKLDEIFYDIKPSIYSHFIDCGSVGSDDETKCNMIITAIVKYVQTLNTQLTNSDGSIKLNNLYYSTPISLPYTSIGIKGGTINPSAETLQAMQSLTNNYDKIMNDYIFTTHYLTTLRNRLDTPTHENLRDAAERLKNQINNVYLSPSYNILYCYKDVISDTCVTIKNNIDIGVQNYALNNVETKLISYLENTSYSADLFTYNGGDEAESTSYQKTRGCIMTPISAPNYARYALNCDGKWLEIPTELKIVENGLKGELNISGLTYYSIDPKGGDIPIKIIYQDMGLNQDSFDTSFYYLDRVNIQTEKKGESKIKLINDIGTTKLYHNQA